jgi:ribosomal protein S18 acetylase RimI-like enzyme
MGDKEDGVQIRPMEPEDIDAILAVDRKLSGVQRALTYRDLFTGLTGGQIELSFVAETNRQVIGFVLALLTYVPEQVTEACVIQLLGVDPDYWRQGIATKLIEALSGESRSKGIKIVRVMVDQQDSQLQGFFGHLGFRRGRLIDYSRAV